VEVEMGHGIRCVLADVEHEPVAALGDPFGLGHVAGGGEDTGERFGVTGFEHAGIVDVASGDHEDVHGSLGVEVAKGHGELGTVHDVGGDLTGDDAAEETVCGVDHRR
jgi:hypothetical protein